MLPDNPILAAHPDKFSFTRSPGRTAVFAIVALAAVVVGVLLMVNFEAVREFGYEAQTRRSRAIAPYFPYLVIGASFLLAAWAAFKAVTTGAWVTAAGKPLKKQQWILGGDLQTSWQRLNTGDPSVYLPLPITKQQQSLPQILRAYTAEGEPATYVTLNIKGLKNNKGDTPLIVFTGQAHEAFTQVRGRLNKPYA